MRGLFPTNSGARRKARWTLAIVTALLAISTSIYAITRTEAPNAPTVVAYELAPADVFVVKPQAMTRALRLSGTLGPVRHSVVKARSVGVVLEVRAHEGERVRRGATLVRIDPANLQAELEVRMAALRKAQAELALATKNRDNSVALLAQKLISQNAFDQTIAAYETGVANEQTAAAQLRLAQIALNDTEIRADFDGVVATRKIQVGERVMPDAVLLTIVDLALMQLEALVPVADIPTVRVGQPAHFRVDGFGAREFVGRVERISPQAEPGTRSLTVYLSVANADAVLKGGMFADGELILQHTAPLLAIPTTAIRTINLSDTVLALEDGVVVERHIVRGDVFPAAGLTAVREGLTESAVIIVGSTMLKPGMQAKLTTDSKLSSLQKDGAKARS